MLTWAKKYSIIFFLGVIIFALAIAGGAIEDDDILSNDRRLRTFRYVGGTLMLMGLALWVAKSRIEEKRLGLNPVFGLLLAASSVLSITGLVVDLVSNEIFSLGLEIGLAVAAAALVIGVLAMIFSPLKREHYDYPWYAPDFDAERDAYAAGQVVPTVGYAANDLKRIAGIDEKIEKALYVEGIKYYNRLAETSPYELAAILGRAGMEGIDTSTWPSQARLADNGEWEALAKLQQKLAA